MINQCVICGISMPEGDQVCRGCREGDTKELRVKRKYDGDRVYYSMPNPKDFMTKRYVDITTDPYHMGQLLICAVRYAIGRDTSIPATVAGQVQINLRNLQTGHLEAILRDIREARHLGRYDTTTWLDLADRIDGELAGREAI